MSSIISHSSFSQIKHDSIHEVESKLTTDCKIITGSGIRPASPLNLQSKILGYELIYFDIAPCQMDLDPAMLKRRISFIELSQDTLTVEVAITEPCCIDVLGEIEIIGSNTVNLIYSTCGETECFCYCCYSLKYQIKCNQKLKDLTFKLNSTHIEESENVYILEEKIIDTLEDNTIVAKVFRDKILFKEVRQNKELKEWHMLLYNSGKLQHEIIRKHQTGIMKLITRRSYKNSLLVSETIENQLNNSLTKREFDCGQLIQETISTLEK